MEIQLIVVEHDETTIRSADHLLIWVRRQGYRRRIVAQGALEEILQEEKSLTGKLSFREREIEVPRDKKKAEGIFERLLKQANTI